MWMWGSTLSKSLVLQASCLHQMCLQSQLKIYIFFFCRFLCCIQGCWLTYFIDVERNVFYWEFPLNFLSRDSLSLEANMGAWRTAGSRDTRQSNNVRFDVTHEVSNTLDQRSCDKPLQCSIALFHTKVFKGWRIIFGNKLFSLLKKIVIVL